MGLTVLARYTGPPAPPPQRQRGVHPPGAAAGATRLPPQPPQRRVRGTSGGRHTAERSGRGGKRRGLRASCPRASGSRVYSSGI